jgi:hypothetical protein
MNAKYRHPKEYKTADFIRELASLGIRRHRNSVRKAIARGDLEVIVRDNGRGGRTKRILADLPRDLIDPSTWLGKRYSFFGKQERRRLYRRRSRLEWGDVYRLVFEFTLYAAGIPQLSPIGRMTVPRRPMTLPLRIRSSIGHIVDARSRGIYISQVTRGDWHAPIRTEAHMEEAIRWLRRLPREEMGRWQKSRTKKVLSLLAQATYKQREMNLQMLRAFRVLNKKDVLCTLEYLAETMGISPTCLQYHLRNNDLMNFCCAQRMPSIGNREIGIKQALDDDKLRVTTRRPRKQKKDFGKYDFDKDPGFKPKLCRTTSDDKEELNASNPTRSG